MRSPFYFIVKPHKNRRYDSTKNLGGIDFITSVSKEDHTVSNRYAEVYALPINYKGPIEVGDTLLVHHNVFKYYFDMKGREKSGRSFFMDDLFFIDFDQFYLYKHKGKWHSHKDFCFVEPVKSKDSIYFKPGTKEELTGILKYGNDTLDKLGVQEGDEVIFTPDSEYEFVVDDQILYRMKTKNICATL